MSLQNSPSSSSSLYYLIILVGEGATFPINWAVYTIIESQTDNSKWNLVTAHFKPTVIPSSRHQNDAPLFSDSEAHPAAESKGTKAACVAPRTHLRQRGQPNFPFSMDLKHSSDAVFFFDFIYMAVSDFQMFQDVDVA